MEPGMTDARDRILLTGATGYVGGRLLQRLERDQHLVRCLTRRPSALAPRAAETTEVVAGDLLVPESLPEAMREVRTAYYLVHSMDAPERFEELDRRAATNFAEAAREAGVAQIVYLSGLGAGENLSTHLASRHEVGEILRSSGVPTTELRASIVIGAGSASFETVRAVVEGLPAIPAPKGVETAAQPIAIEDLIEYLRAARILRCVVVCVEVSHPVSSRPPAAHRGERFTRSAQPSGRAASGSDPSGARHGTTDVGTHQPHRGMRANATTQGCREKNGGASVAEPTAR
jgi:uncharacterized protein YbjT (DUF2867 family)